MEENEGEESFDTVSFKVLSNVLQSVPWLIDFIVDSGWAQEIVRSVVKSFSFLEPGKISRTYIKTQHDKNTFQLK
jgi:hypothetical protein